MRLSHERQARPGDDVTVWTIGHSTRSIEEFLALLVEHQVTTMADVRRFPGSRRHPQFGQTELAESLARVGMVYEHFPELGGRRRPAPGSPNTAWRNDAFRGYADYMATEPFRNGLSCLIDLAETRRTAIVCAEALWWRCHRALIADALKVAGHRVVHIAGPGKIEEHPYTSAAHLEGGQLSYALDRDLLRD